MGHKGPSLAHHILGSQRQCAQEKSTGVHMDYQKWIVKDVERIVHLKRIERHVPVIIQLKRKQHTGQEF